MKSKNHKAICQRCGSWKRWAKQACESCSFQPVKPEDLAKAFILSESFTVGGQTIGRSHAELSAIADKIRSGEQPTFESSEVESVEGSIKAFLSVRPTEIFVGLLRWIAPPFVLLGAVYLLIAFLR
jgi:hypothetical protein